jgi:glutaredoxin-like protein NrdH
MTTVTVYTKPACVQCNAVKRSLRSKGIPFVEKDLTSEENAEALKWFKSKGYASAPVTQYGDFDFPGFDPISIDRLVELYEADHPQDLN